MERFVKGDTIHITEIDGRPCNFTTVLTDAVGDVYFFDNPLNAEKRIRVEDADLKAVKLDVAGGNETLNEVYHYIKQQQSEYEDTARYIKDERVEHTLEELNAILDIITD